MTPERRSLLLGTIVAVVAIVVVIVGIVLFGSPVTRRQLRFDSVRVTNLQSIRSVLGTHETGKDPVALPQSLDEMLKRPDAWIQLSEIRDPETKELYGFHRRSDTSYELCATFSLPSSAQPTDTYSSTFGTLGTFWEHPAGMHCYALDTTLSDVLTKDGRSTLDERATLPSAF
jgi:hypothetical protein